MAPDLQPWLAMKSTPRCAVAIAAAVLAGSAAADITCCEDQGFRGESFNSVSPHRNLDRAGFDDQVSAVDVLGERWEVCEHHRFTGCCAILRPSRYPSMGSMGLNDWLSSARPLNRDARVDDERCAPAPLYDARQRPSERPYRADVTSVRAVVGQPEQRGWVEREQVSVDRRRANIPAGIAGAVIGGILDHDVSGGTGKKPATAGGTVGGALRGANIGRGGGVETQDVKRCENMGSDGRPDYWHVDHVFRGMPHHAQKQIPPGPTITVNARGEPRA